MSLWRRAPREVYRVYGEDQYLEGETAPDDKTAGQEDTTTVEPDRRGVASWTAFAADVPPASAAGAGFRSVPRSGSHAGRLIGVGLLVGVGLATLALVFLNVWHQRGAAPGPLGQGARVEARQRVAYASGAGSASAIAHSGSEQGSTPGPSASSAMAPERRSRSKLNDEARPAHDSDTTPRVQRVWSAALGPSAYAGPASVAVQPPAPVVVEPSPPNPVEPSALGRVEPSVPVAAELSVQDEFGFEQ